MGERKSYSDRLKDPRWQRRRLEILDKANFTCQECFSKERTLHVHHRLYRSGADPWEYEDHELQCLCEVCHDAITRLHHKLKDRVALLDATAVEILIGYVDGLLLMATLRGLHSRGSSEAIHQWGTLPIRPFSRSALWGMGESFSCAGGEAADVLGVPGASNADVLQLYIRFYERSRIERANARIAISATADPEAAG